MEPVYRFVAGIDVHKKMLAVVIRRQSGEDIEYRKRKFGTSRIEIEHLSAWLQSEGVAEVVMRLRTQAWNRLRNIGGRFGMA
ncbi:MAG: hypothetical protein ACR2NN_04915 [Bryobacteraceae bacterium]